MYQSLAFRVAHWIGQGVMSSYLDMTFGSISKRVTGLARSEA